MAIHGEVEELCGKEGDTPQATQGHREAISDTAKPRETPQSPSVHRKTEIPTAKKRAPPQKQLVHREVSAPAAKDPALPRVKVLRRKACHSTARSPSLPQGLVERGEVSPFTAKRPCSPRLRGGQSLSAWYDPRRTIHRNSEPVRDDMGAKLSVEEVVGNLERRVVFHREQEALHTQQVVFHTQQEEHHREQQALHAAELQKVLQSLETFRTAAGTAVDLAQALPPAAQPAAA